MLGAEGGTDSAKRLTCLPLPHVWTRDDAWRYHNEQMPHDSASHKCLPKGGDEFRGELFAGVSL